MVVTYSNSKLGCRAAADKMLIDSHCLAQVKGLTRYRGNSHARDFHSVTHLSQSTSRAGPLFLVHLLKRVLII